MKTVLEQAWNNPELAIARINAGLEWPEVEHLGALLDLPLSRLCELLQIPQATMTRRRQQGRFDQQESDRIMRFARLWFLACEAVGGPEGARSWLTREQYGLRGAMPLELARTEVGAREVEALLQRIHFGILA
jgi:putative toxin-antitoxin system antitoxin component (TIGR02293 family)